MTKHERCVEAAQDWFEANDIEIDDEAIDVLVIEILRTAGVKGEVDEITGCVGLDEIKHEVDARGRPRPHGRRQRGDGIVMSEISIDRLRSVIACSSEIEAALHNAGAATEGATIPLNIRGEDAGTLLLSASASWRAPATPFENSLAQFAGRYGVTFDVNRLRLVGVNSAFSINSPQRLTVDFVN
jgi:hypothetical protein